MTEKQPPVEEPSVGAASEQLPLQPETAPLPVTEEPPLTEPPLEQAEAGRPESAAAPQSFSQLSTLCWDGTKQMAAWSIDASEQLACEVLKFQERTASWAKDTPWASFAQSQTSLARQWIAGAADLARQLWRLRSTEQVERS